MNKQHEDILTLGTFLLDGLEFGVDLLTQREVLRMMPVTKMPCSVDYVEGVIQIRGTIIPVVNLRTRFGMPPQAFNAMTRIINIEVTDDLIVGFIVDSVGQVRRMNSSMIEPPPPVIASLDSDYITGVGKFEDSLLLILDVPRVLSGDDIKTLGALA